MNMFILHPFHLVDNSPWPIMISMTTLNLVMSGIAVMRYIIMGKLLLLLNFIILFCIALLWFRDIIREGTYLGNHTKKVQQGLILGFYLFIVSELFLFIAFFWAFFHSSLSPSIDIGGIWPPIGIQILNTFNIPLLNTIILLSSGATITWTHYSIINNKREEAINSLIITILLAVLFTALQIFEYFEAPFSLSSSIYGSTFFMLTGLHGLHVIMGTILLLVSLIRLYYSHFTTFHHLGFLTASIYYHFVDVVWIFLFVTIYYWGGS